MLSRYFEHRLRRHRPIRRDDREVHRRRGHGRLGDAGGPRGRRGTERPGGARAGRRGQGARADHPGTGGHPDRRSRGHPRRHQPGDGRGRPRQHGRATPIGGGPARSSSAKATARATEAAIAYEAARRAGAQGQGRAGPCLARRPGRGRTRRAEPEPIRSRRRSSAVTRSCGCSRTCSTRPVANDAPGWSASSGRPGSARAAWPGSSTKYLDGVTEDDLLARRALAVVRRGHHLLGARRDGPRSSRLAESDDEATTRRKVAESVAAHRVRRDRAALDRVRAAGPARVRRGALGAEQLFAAWRTYFERLAAHGPGGHGLRGPALGRHRHRSTSSSTCSSGRKGVPIYVVTLARPELLERRPELGRGQAELRLDVPRAARPAPAMEALLAGLVRPAGAARQRRSSSGPTASRCTRSRPSGCSSPTGRSSRTAGSIDRSATSPPLAVPETLHGAHRGTSRRARRAGPRAAPGRRRSSARASRVPALAAVSGVDEGDSRPGCRALVRRELLTVQVDPRSPERGQYVFVQSLIREVAYNTLSRRRPAQGRSPRGRTLLRVGSGTDELAGALATHYLARTREQPGRPGGRRRRGPGADRPARRGRARHRARIAPPRLRPSTTRRARSPRIRRTSPTCSSGPGLPPTKAAWPTWPIERLHDALTSGAAGRTTRPSSGRRSRSPVARPTTSRSTRACACSSRRWSGGRRPARPSTPIGSPCSPSSHARSSSTKRTSGRSTVADRALPAAERLDAIALVARPPRSRVGRSREPRALPRRARCQARRDPPGRRVRPDRPPPCGDGSTSAPTSRADPVAAFAIAREALRPRRSSGATGMP